MNSSASRAPRKRPSYRRPGPGPRRGDLFDRLTIGKRVREGLIPRYALRNIQAPFHALALAHFFDALVNVIQQRLQIDDGLARDAEPEMPRLYDAGVDRPTGIS